MGFGGGGATTSATSSSDQQHQQFNITTNTLAGLRDGDDLVRGTRLGGAGPAL